MWRVYFIKYSGSHTYTMCRTIKFYFNMICACIIRSDFHSLLILCCTTLEKGVCIYNTQWPSFFVFVWNNVHVYYTGLFIICCCVIGHRKGVTFILCFIVEHREEPMCMYITQGSSLFAVVLYDIEMDRCACIIRSYLHS